MLTSAAPFHRPAFGKFDARVDAALNIWREIVAAMPPIRNVALRDTLASLGELKRLYDTRFAAHVVPYDIDYQLSEPIDPRVFRVFVQAFRIALCPWAQCQPLCFENHLLPLSTVGRTRVSARP